MKLSQKASRWRINHRSLLGHEPPQSEKLKSVPLINGDMNDAVAPAAFRFVYAGQQPARAGKSKNAICRCVDFRSRRRGGAGSEGVCTRHAADGTERRRLRQPRNSGRSEEHTSELQSRENLVCRLLLEKKKKKNRWSRVHLS